MEIYFCFIPEHKYIFSLPQEILFDRTLSVRLSLYFFAFALNYLLQSIHRLLPTFKSNLRWKWSKRFTCGVEWITDQ